MYRLRDIGTPIFLRKFVPNQSTISGKNDSLPWWEPKRQF